METPVELLVRFGRSQITGRQLLSLKPGDILMLENDVDELLEAEIQGVRKFQGIPGLVKSNKAFQIVKEEEIRLE
jgi:flagellar motor switch protein FliM